MNRSRRQISSLLMLPAIAGIFVFEGCGDDHLTNSTGVNPLIGEWAETFAWRPSIPYGFDIGGPSAITRTTTLTITEDGFRVTVFPRRRTWDTNPDDLIFTTWADDTLYVGTYSHTSNRITFYVEGRDEPQEFTYRLDPDGLHLTWESGSYYDPINRVWVVSFYGPFLWAYSGQKTSGALTRVE